MSSLNWSRWRDLKLRELALALAVPGFLLVVWEWFSHAGVLPESLIASPSQVLPALVEFVLNGKLLRHSLTSVYRLLAGFFLGSLVGLSLGVLVGLSKTFELLIDPTMRLFSPIPPTAWIPLLIILLGIDEGSKIALIAVGVTAVVYLNTVQGVRSVEKKFVDLARVHKKNDFHLVSRVLLPSAAPQIFTGLRIALGLSWVLLIAAEVVASYDGLGWLLWDSRNFSRPAEMVVAMIAIGSLGKFSDILLVFAEKKLVFWRTTFEGR